MAVGTYIGKTAFVNSTGSVSVDFSALDSGAIQAGDTLVIIVETARQPITSISGFIEPTGSPASFGIAGSAGGVSIQTFIKNDADGTESTVVVGDSGDHTIAIGAVLRPPVGVSALAVDVSAGLGGSAVGDGDNIYVSSVTTSVADTLALLAYGVPRDAVASNISSWIQGGLDAVPTEHHDESVTDGIGGGIAFATSFKNAAGSTGASVGAVVSTGGAINVARMVVMFRNLASPNITSAATVENLVNTTLAHTITADKTIVSTVITGGADAASFEINGASTLRFASNAASSALGSLVVDVEITDTDGLTDTQTLTVPVKAIIFKGAKTYSRAGSTSTATSSLTNFRHPDTGTTNIPAAVGDTVVVFPAIGSTADRDMIISTGYTEQADHYSNGTSFDANIGLHTKALSSADTTVTFGSSGNSADAQGGVLMLFSGVDPTTPMDVAVVLGNGTGTGKPDPQAITPITPGSVGIFGGAQAAATAVALTSSDLTGFRQVTQSDNNDIAVGAGFIEWSGSGAINPAAFGGGSSNAANSWATVSAVLRPAWTGGGPTQKPYSFGFVL